MNTQQTDPHDDLTAPDASGRGESIPSPAELGIGMRLSVHPHTDDFAAVIGGALADVEEQGLTHGLVTETDTVSTWVGAREQPAEQRLVAYAAGLVAAASRRSGGGHVVAHVLLSRGCPGEVTCDPRAAAGAPRPVPVDLARTGIAAQAQWSLYPLLDGSSGGGEHMDHIMGAIEGARRRGTAASPAHYATLLEGDLADVLATAADAWAEVGTAVPHVVAHLTVSVGSPSVRTGA